MANLITLHLEALRLAMREKPLHRRNFKRARRYVLDREAFVAAGGEIRAQQPMLHDFSASAGSANGHYFHQDLLVATKIHAANPRKHVDVGSRIDGFVAHVASFREIEVFDIRPLTPGVHPRIKFVRGDLMVRAGVPQAYCDSLSCLHALEHFGLGRYGDPIDPQGHMKGFDNLCKMLSAGGTLYLSVPIGARGTCFNAHRVFHPSDVPAWSRERLQLEDYAYVDDVGDLHMGIEPANTPALRYGCGIYTLRKL
jgi:hypothetical protein